MGAALEALEKAGFPGGQGAGRLGIVQCMFNGCVQFSGKFYHEVIETPALASPLIFPETVYNAPASHIAAYLGVDGPVTTLIGEASAIMDGVATAHTWLTQGIVDRVLVIGAEECDWLGAEAVTYYHPSLIASEGAGALLLSLEDRGCVLEAMPGCAFLNEQERATMLPELVKQAPAVTEGFVIRGECGIPMLDEAERAAWQSRPENDATSLRPRVVLGESMGAGGALALALAAETCLSTSQSGTALLPGSIAAAHLVSLRAK
jgi:hypothetical protein